MLQKGGDLVVVATYPEHIIMDVTKKIVREMKTVRGVLGGSKVAWSRALNLMALGKLKVRPLITHRLPLERAEEGFRACIEKKALKVILLP
jgi:threonine dehydrogenase-like Zn-dependent dehydrogenase